MPRPKAAALEASATTEPSSQAEPATHPTPPNIRYRAAKNDYAGIPTDAPYALVIECIFCRCEMLSRDRREDVCEDCFGREWSDFWDKKQEQDRRLYTRQPLVRPVSPAPNPFRALDIDNHSA